MEDYGTRDPEPFRPDTRLARRMADGHKQRTGHTLTGVYVTAYGVSRLVRTCCK